MSFADEIERLIVDTVARARSDAPYYWARSVAEILLKDARLVTGFIDDGAHFGTDSRASDTHTALVINVRPIKRPKVTKDDIREELARYRNLEDVDKLLERIERDGLEGDA